MFEGKNCWLILQQDLVAGYMDGWEKVMSWFKGLLSAGQT
jgi:hypothetical protein